jgi:Ser/Thr protein kinase RdoA (MazF antagonist)
LSTEALAAHLEAHYGIRVARISTMEGPVYRVDRADGQAWVARVFPPPRTRKQVEGDAEVLRYLERRGFPAERCACPEPVSSCGTETVIVTEHVDGPIAHGDAPTLTALGELLGRLQTLSVDDAVARKAGSLHHSSPNGGGPGADLAAAASWLDGVETLVRPAYRAQYDSLRELLERTDAGDDLPTSFVHPDFHRGNVLESSDGFVVIDWTGAGVGPRVGALGMLLFTAVAKQYAGEAPHAPDVARVDAVVAGYRNHVQLGPDELARLADAIRRPPLVLSCFLFWAGVRASGVPPARGPWSPPYELAEPIAARVRDALAWS